MNSQIEQLRRLSSMPAFIHNPNTPVARALTKMLNRKPMKSAAKTRAKTPTRSRLSIEKSKRNNRIKKRSKKTRRVNSV